MFQIASTYQVQQSFLSLVKLLYQSTLPRVVTLQQGHILLCAKTPCPSAQEGIIAMHFLIALIVVVVCYALDVKLRVQACKGTVRLCINPRAVPKTQAK